MRGWSASSGTPTACESSTAASITTSTFNNNRPPSLHTADTSVDFSIGTISPKLKPARSFTRTCSTARDSDSDSVSHYEDSKHAEIIPFPPETTAVGRAFNIEDYLSPEPDLTNPHANEDMTITTTTATIPSASATTTDTFNIDDYLSSDAESLTAAAAAAAATTTTTTTHSHRRRPTAEGEEYLLLKGFGTAGTQLPGIADPFPPSPPLPPPSRARSTSQANQRHSVLTLPLSPFYGVSDDLMYDDDRRRWGGGTGVVAGRRRRGMSTGRWERDAIINTVDWDRVGTGVGRRRFILDTAADYETEEEVEFGEGEEEDGEEEDGEEESNQLRNNNIKRLGVREVEDAGYEADYVEDECQCGARQRRRQRKKRTRRLSALCRLEGREEEESQGGVRLQEEQQQQQLEENQRVEEQKKVEDKVAAAVRLRKEVRRARRLAGQPSTAVLRRKGSAN